MSVKTLTSKLKHQASQAKTLHVEPLIESGQALVSTGIETAKSVGGVVADSVSRIVETQIEAGRSVIAGRSVSAVVEAAKTAKDEIVATLSDARGELRDTIKGGYEAAGDRLSRFSTPSRKLQAAAKKADVKAKKAAQRLATA